MKPYMRAKEVATLLSISIKTVYKLIEKKELLGLRIGRAVSVSVASLDAFIARNQTGLAVPEPEPQANPEPSQRRARQAKKRAARTGFRHVPPREPR